MFKKEFISEAKALYPTWNDLHTAIESGLAIVGRYLDDSTPTGINYHEVLSAESLDELKQKAMIIKRKNDLLNAYRSGACYQTECEKRKSVGCPRLYAQMAGDDDTLNAFKCYGVFHIPSCSKFSSGECWKRFDELGLQMK